MMLSSIKRVTLSLGLLALAAQTAHAGLVGHWKLDDGAGTVATDATGRGHDGELIGDPTWVQGHFGGALKFTGSPQKVDIPFSAELNPTDTFTVSVWANVDPTGSSHRSPVTSRDDYPQRGYIIYVEPGNTWQFWTGTGAGWNNTAGPAAEFDEWTLVTATVSGGENKLYINGSLAAQSTAAFSPNTQQVLRIGAGATEGDGNYFFVGLVDDVRVYNHAMTEAELAYLLEGKPYPFAGVVSPQPGVMIGANQATLQWTSGELAVSHNVYLGEDEQAVADATPEDTDVFVGSVTTNSVQVGGPAGLTPGQTYYWRVDEIDDSNPDSPWKGPVWSFRVQPLTAWNPQPADGVKYIRPGQSLSWSAGQGVIFHTVYLGESLDEVANATADGWMTTETSYTLDSLKTDTTYYWRVDEFSPTGTQKGTVWSFRTLPEIEVTDPSLLAWWKLDEGAGRNVIDWSGHGHHGALGGNPQWVNGCFGSALAFNGSTDYVDFGTPADLYLPQSYSYCVWFKVGRSVVGNSGAQYLLCNGSRSDLVLGVEDAVGVDGDVSLHYYDTAPGFHAVGVGQVMWPADQWHLVVATKDATGHKIYLDGELKNSDTNANDDNYNTTRMISLGARAWTSPQVAFFNGALDEVRVYDRALSEDEIAQLVRGDPLLASEPSPARNATLDIRDVDSLTWTAGDTAASHDVYFGTDGAAVAAADQDAPEFQGNQKGTSVSLADLVVFGGGDYYWRIDEVEADGTVHPGNVWKFAVPAYLLIEDFESYTDVEGNRIYETWIDGWTNGTSSQVGYLSAAGDTFAERQIVHSGGQSMPLDYNNLNSPYYSETQRTWTTAQDWTAEDVDTLTLYFRGRTANGAEKLYVALEDSTGKTAVVVHPDPEAVLAGQWTEWDIPLSAFTGVNTSRVEAMYIGLGDRDNPAPGGAGLLFIDDIRLTRSQP